MREVLPRKRTVLSVSFPIPPAYNDVLAFSIELSLPPLFDPLLLLQYLAPDLLPPGVGSRKVVRETSDIHELYRYSTHTLPLLEKTVRSGDLNSG